MIVVPVLITSCQALLKLKSGPEINQISTIAVAATKAHRLPINSDARAANAWKRTPIRGVECGGGAMVPNVVPERMPDSLRRFSVPDSASFGRLDKGRD